MFTRSLALAAILATASVAAQAGTTCPPAKPDAGVYPYTTLSGQCVQIVFVGMSQEGGALAQSVDGDLFASFHLDGKIAEWHISGSETVRK